LSTSVSSRCSFSCAAAGPGRDRDRSFRITVVIVNALSVTPPITADATALAACSAIVQIDGRSWELTPTQDAASTLVLTPCFV
jgi:hypothetical protein